MVFSGITVADELAKSPSNRRTQWSLRHSRPSDDGQFLNVPIFYGDWVPIGSAKAAIESIAGAVKIDPSENRRKDVVKEEIASVPEVLEPDVIEAPPNPSPIIDIHHHLRPQHHQTTSQQHYQTHHPQPLVHEADERLDIDHVPPRFIGPRLPHKQPTYHHNEPSNIRHHTPSRPHNRLRALYPRRRHRPSTNSDALTRLFGQNFGQVINGNRRHHRKIPQTSSNLPLVNQIGSIFGATPTQDTAASQSTGSSAFEALGSVFNFLSPSSLKDSSWAHSNQESSEVVDGPTIKLLPSPDLTQVRIINVDSILAVHSNINVSEVYHIILPFDVYLITLF